MALMHHISFFEMELLPKLFVVFAVSAIFHSANIIRKQDPSKCLAFRARFFVGTIIYSGRIKRECLREPI